MRTRKADMINLSNIPQPMTVEEKEDLFNNWNEDSWKILAERNIRLAILIAKKFCNSGIDEEELFSIAQFGLVKAAKKFRPDNGNEFSTFASVVITNDILMQMRKNRKIPSLIYSLNELIIIGHDSDACELGELIACTKNPFEELEERQFLEYIREALTCFTEKERRVILLSLDGLKQREIGYITGFSQSYISRILKSCKVRFKRRLERYKK